jgi:hypothetical protein
VALRICAIGLACTICGTACRSSTPAAEGGAPELASDFKGIATVAPPPPTVGIPERGAPDAGEPDGKSSDHGAVVTALKDKVFGGHATETETRLLISFCKEDGDKECIRLARRFLE